MTLCFTTAACSLPCCALQTLYCTASAQGTLALGRLLLLDTAAPCHDLGNRQWLISMVLMQGRAMPIVRIGRPTLPAQAQMQLQLCRQLQEGQCPSVVSQRISWLQVSCLFKCLEIVISSCAQRWLLLGTSRSSRQIDRRAISF